MCTVGDEIEHQGSSFMQDKLKTRLVKYVCMKCDSMPCIVLHHKYPYCRNCFVNGTIHKFKALIGKTRLIQPNENVLVYYKAGHPSTALLHFLRAGLDLTTPKKICFVPVILHIENEHNLSVTQRKGILNNIYNEIQHFKFQSYFVSFARYILNPNNLECYIHKNYEELSISDEDSNNIASVIKTKCNLTAQQEISRTFLQELLIKVAQILNCKYIFMPDFSIDIATQLLTSVSLGRGPNIVYDMGTVDSRNENVTIIRPLRNFYIKELALYNVFNQLNPVTFLKESQNPYSNVQNLMKTFVSNLQVNYPSTVSTIVRTGDKLEVNSKLYQHKKCLLCKVPLENIPDRLGSVEATSFSHWISTQSPNSKFSLEEQFLNDFKNDCDLEYCFACSKIVDYL